MVAHLRSGRFDALLMLPVVALCLLALPAADSIAQEDMTYRITNPDFEDGLDGWTKGSDGTAPFSNGAAPLPLSGSLAYRVGTYLYDLSWGDLRYSAGDSAFITQSVDLTGVDTLSFWHFLDYVQPHPSVRQRVYVDGDMVWEAPPASSWTQATVDLSAYTGTCELKLGAWVTGSVNIAVQFMFDFLQLSGSGSENGDGEGGEDQDLIPPIMKPEPSYTYGTSNTVSLVDPNIPEADEYQFELSDREGGLYNFLELSPWQSGKSYEFTDLDPGVRYYYRARCRTVHSSDTVLFEDDFEDGNWDAWTAESSWYEREVTSETAAGGSYSFSQQKPLGTEGHYDGVSRSIGLLTPDEIMFSVRSSSSEHSTGFFRTDNLDFYMSRAGTMGIHCGDAFHGTEYAAHTWYDIRLTLDWDAQTLDYYVDEMLIAESIPFRGQSTLISVVHLYNFDGGPEAWWDEIQFLGGAVPSDWSNWVHSEQTDDDRFPPTCTITYPEDGQVIDGPLERISGTATDDETGIDYVEVYLRSLESGRYWNWGEASWHGAHSQEIHECQWMWYRLDVDDFGEWEITSHLPYMWPDGDYRVGARAVDLAGNTTWSTFQTVQPPVAEFTIANTDTTPPSVSITFPDDGGSYPTLSQFLGTADDGDGVGVDHVRWQLSYWCDQKQTWMRWNAWDRFWMPAGPEWFCLADGTTNWSVTSDLPDTWDPRREYSLRVVAVDRAGNMEPNPFNWERVRFSVGVDAPAPELTDLKMGRVERDEAVVNWRTNLAASSEVGFGTESQEAFGDYPTVAIGPGDTQFHAVLLPGLTEDTTYFLRARSTRGGQVAISDEISFTTSAQQQPTLAYTGDTSGEISDTLTLAGTLTHDGEPIVGATIHFVCNNVTAVAITGEDGVAETQIAADRLGVGTHTVHLRFAGDAEYLPAQGRGQITISPNLTHTIVRGEGTFFRNGNRAFRCMVEFRFNADLTAGWLRFVDVRAQKRVEVAVVKSVMLSPDGKSGPEATIVCGPNDEYTVTVNADTNAFEIIEGAAGSPSYAASTDGLLGDIVIEEGQIE